jgi:hypothetical protein
MIVLGLPVLQSKADENLKGLGRITVLVEDFGNDTAKVGISEVELKAIVELRLRQSGVAVDKIEDRKQQPYLYVAVHPMYLEKTDHFIISTRVSLNEIVRLQRNDTTTIATTWNKGNLTIAPRNISTEHIKQSVDSLLTFFLNDYLAANPKTIK